MGSIGAWELLIILIMVAVIFGGKKLPELGRGLGKGLANFRQSVREPDSTAETAPEPVSVSAEKESATVAEANAETPAPAPEEQPRSAEGQ